MIFFILEVAIWYDRSLKHSKDFLLKLLSHSEINLINNSVF